LSRLFSDLKKFISFLPLSLRLLCSVLPLPVIDGLAAMRATTRFFINQLEAQSHRMGTPL